MEFEIVANVGNRECNEDYVDAYLHHKDSSNFGMFILADGLGGHGRGEVASKLVVESCLDYYKRHEVDEDVIAKGIEYAQESLLQTQMIEKAKDEMKTTMVVLRITERAIQWGHVGDSRLYYFCKKKLVKRTIDHSIPQMLALAGEIKDKDIRNHPDRNKLLRVMGTPWEEPQYVISDEIKRTGKDAFLLCSDGFWENITEKEMVKCLRKAKNAKQWITLMNDLVQKHGKDTDMDNNTALVVMA